MSDLVEVYLLALEEPWESQLIFGVYRTKEDAESAMRAVIPTMRNVHAEAEYSIERRSLGVLSKDGADTFWVYDIKGRLVRSWQDGVFTKGQP